MIFVAKSYEGLEKIGEPYLKSGRSYIKVLTKAGQEKEVRVYTEKEYIKMYPEVKVSANSKPYGPQMNCLGFRDKGDFITIFFDKKGKLISGDDKYFTNYREARYHKNWGWYLIGGVLPPYSALADDVYPCGLSWTLVGQEDGYLKEEKEILQVIKILGKEVAEYYASK